MLVHFGVDNLAVEWTASTSCIGTFDGVHRGHQHVLNRAVELARSHEQPSVVVTFDRHPLAVLAPDRCPPAIGTLEQNVIALRQLGLSACVIMPFDRALATESAESFFQRVLLEGIRAERVVVGHDFAFGFKRQGDHEFLKSRIETHVVNEFKQSGTRVSSTEIRASVAEGDVENAQRLLGRPFSLAGVVVAGQKLGRTIGFPTINLARSMKTVVPKDGVYACRCFSSKGQFEAAASIGIRPTVGGTHRTIEAYLLDYPGDSLYGERVEIQFLHRLRDELKFDSLPLLVSQMNADVELARKLISENSQN